MEIVSAFTPSNHVTHREHCLYISHLATIKAVDGITEVKRVVCGGCMDYKIIICLDGAKFGAFESAEFAPEKAFLEAAGKIEGISNLETQTYTFEQL
jgi:hypothetical protein